MNRSETQSKPLDFIDDAAIARLLDRPAPDRARVREILQKSLGREPLSCEETADLLRMEEPDAVAELHDSARQVKQTIYGNRVVLFAPLYVGNLCRNDCLYCGFRRSNQGAVRRTLDHAELAAEVEALLATGQKRLILVFGEHPRYTPEFIASAVRTVYSVRAGANIRRVNLNAPPFSTEGFAVIKEAGIGTYQIFQETYHHETYARMHPAGTAKHDYLWRLSSLDRAMEAGCDDVGLGVLFGLHDWRFEVLSLVRHSEHLRERFGVGPHTISVPRLRPASGAEIDGCPQVSDEQMKRIVAILRLAVPYTGIILTAREETGLRRELLDYGVSQIDAGSRIELGGYAEKAAGAAQEPDREQFVLGDMRPLEQVVKDLLEENHLPSFCTACYRVGRTGEHFMEFAIPGFIQRFCTPNALLTLMEYLIDYASEETRTKGETRIREELDKLPPSSFRDEVRSRCERIRRGERDLYF